MVVRSLLVVAALVVAPSRSDADVFKLFGEAHGGAVFGKGTAGDAVDADKDFFANVPHGMYGLRVGARFLIFDGTIQHHQFRNSDRVQTWTQFMAGMSMLSELGSDQQKKAGHSSYAELGAQVGFGIGTGAQVMPPLSNDEVTDKAFIAEGRLGFGKHLNPLMDIGIIVPVSWGYFLKSDFASNDLSGHYKSVQVELLAYFRFNIVLL
jgi:hypothetical protein